MSGFDKCSEKNRIEQMAECFVKALSPLKIYLFGSFAEGKDEPGSDYDFYIVVEDERADNNLIWATTAHKAIRELKNRPVDILVNTNQKFNQYKCSNTHIEKEVFDKGVLIYER